MREYMGVYRGKRLDNGAWVDGNLITLHDSRCYIINNKFGACIDFDGNFIMTEAPFVCEVDPKTVGECTGLRYEGKLIFEGDLFGFDDDCIGVVIFKDGCFRMQVYGMCETYTEAGYSEDGGGWGIVECEPIDWYYVKDLGIIGNVHDNPELVKGGADDAAD